MVTTYDDKTSSADPAATEAAELPALDREELLRYGRHLLLAEVGLEGQQRLKAARVLLVGAGGDPETLDLIARHVPHVVLLDDRDTTGRFECIVSDGFGGARQATQYLLGLGHRRIGFFLAEQDVRSFRDRLHGYITALFDAGISPDRRIIVGGTFDDPEEVRAARLCALLEGPEPATALLAANDEYGFFALRAFRQMGVRVPDDISVIGFDDIPFSTHTDPPLTTMRVDKEAMGRLAVHRLMARMRLPERGIVRPVCSPVPVTLVARASCRALGGA
jgi:LacI family transcriptional regulator